MNTKKDAGQGFAGGKDAQANMHPSHFGHGGNGDTEEAVGQNPLDESCPAFPVQGDVIHGHDPSRSFSNGDLPYNWPADSSGSTSFEVIGDSTDAGFREPMPTRCDWEEFGRNPGYKIEAPTDESEMRHNPGMEETMHEYKEGALHSGSKKGPKVKSRAQAIAIGLSEKRKG